MADLDRLRAALQDKYAVERQIGEGGMATVFLAEDLKHHRRVAIKLLRPELSAALGTERFLREIELAAQLQHPHIVPVYDSGAADGLLYYVMPFIDGESLREMLTREGRIPVGRAADIICDAASGLAYAHKHGVVHRDVKPENIMLSGGHAVVTDFGIARAIDASRSANAGLTGTGMAIGTPAYMSPEQATADAVDARSDQYALACVFYEMVSGKQAFSAPTMQALLTQVLTGPRPHLSTVVHSTPPALDAAVTRALSQEPAQRFPDIMAFANVVRLESSGTAAAARESRRWKRMTFVLVPLVAVIAVAAVLLARPHGTVVSGAETIAIVPFRTTGAGLENLGEGMVDLIGGSLDGVGGIHTADSRQVLRAWQRKARNGAPSLEDAIDVARSVKAASVLTGNIVANGKTARLTAELYDLTGKQLARAQLDGSTDSVLTLADRLSVDLLRGIWRSKEPLPSARSSAITSTSVEAIRAYLDGEKWYRRGIWDSAQASYEHAVRADSTFAIAWYKLASTLGWKGQTSEGEAGIAGQNAVKYSANVPGRLRTIMVAYEMFQEGRLEAADSMRAYTTLHPEDADGWDLLAESQYHSRDFRPMSAAELIAPFDRVLALDSTLTAAAIHPMEVALSERDTALARKYLKVFQEAHADEEAQGASAALASLHGDDSGFSSLMTLSTAGMRNMALVGKLMDPATTGTELEKSLRKFVSAMPDVARSQGVFMIGAFMGATGRQHQARAFVDTLRATGIGNDQASYITQIPVLGQFADSGLTARFDSALAAASVRPETAPYVAYYRAMIALDQGHPDKSAALLQPALAFVATPAAPTWLRGSVIGLDGLRMVAGGDPTHGMARVDSGMRVVGTFSNTSFALPILLRQALYLASQPATRTEGIRRLRYGFTDQLQFLPIVQYDLGKAYDAAGDRANALSSYGQFLRLWDRADTNYARRIADARDAMQRLTAEGSKK